MALAASTRVRFPAALHFENRLQRLCVWLCWAFANPDLRCPLYAGHLGGGTYNRVSHECVEGAKLLPARITHAAKIQFNRGSAIPRGGDASGFRFLTYAL